MSDESFSLFPKPAPNEIDKNKKSIETFVVIIKREKTRIGSHEEGKSGPNDPNYVMRSGGT